MKRILVASDLSPSSTNALARAIGLAARDGAEIRIVHSATHDEEREARVSLHQKIAAEARIMAGELTGRDIPFTVRTCSSGAGHAIIHEAERFGADLIILGAHGEPRFRDALFGTTGTHVVRHSDRPVLVVQNEATEPYAKVLIAVDDAHFARPILDATLDVAPASELFAVHAFYPSLRQTIGGPDALHAEEKRQEAELEQLLAEAAAGKPASRLTANKHAVVETGEALEVIMGETEELVPDLLAMGTRARATYLGSHAVDTLFWCPADVLVVPERAAAEVSA